MDTAPSTQNNGKLNNNMVATLSQASKIQDFSGGTFSLKLESDDGFMDDDLDPAMKEELDRWDGG